MRKKPWLSCWRDLQVPKCQLPEPLWKGQLPNQLLVRTKEAPPAKAQPLRKRYWVASDAEEVLLDVKHVVIQPSRARDSMEEQITWTGRRTKQRGERFTNRSLFEICAGLPCHGSDVATKVAQCFCSSKACWKTCDLNCGKKKVKTAQGALGLGSLHKAICFCHLEPAQGWLPATLCWTNFDCGCIS